MREPTLLLRTALLACLLLSVTWTSWAGDVSVTLNGSPSSMVRQNQVARDLGYLFVETPEDIERLVEAGDLVSISGDTDYEVLRNVQYPFARREVRLFIERLAAQYREGTGEKLVVTSLARPTSGQPANAHALSVHPTGMAMDLRVSEQAASQQWLESVLLSLERKGLLDVTREHYPPHYHVALFPGAYRAYLEDMIGAEAVSIGLHPENIVEEPSAPEEALVADTVKAITPTTLIVAPNAAEEEGTWPLPLLVLPLILLGGVLGYRHLKCTMPATFEIEQS